MKYFIFSHMMYAIGFLSFFGVVQVEGYNIGPFGFIAIVRGVCSPILESSMVMNTKHASNNHAYIVPMRKFRVESYNHEQISS